MLHHCCDEIFPAGHGAPSDAGGGAVAQPSESEAAPGLFASARVVPVVDDDAAEDPTLQNQKMEKVAEIRRKRMQIMEDLEKEEEVACVDDFYSPAEPEAYIELRLQKIITFYQDRIPWFYNWRRLAWGYERDARSRQPAYSGGRIYRPTALVG